MPVRLKDIGPAPGYLYHHRALGGYSDVADETRQRVEKAAIEMGYYPDASAQKLQRQRSDTVGFDDIPWAAHSHPSLTTVRQPVYEIGRRVCRMLIQRIRGEELEERHIVLQPEFVVRESTGPST